MNFIALIRIYVNFFYFSGQTPYLNYRLHGKSNENSKWHRLILKIPALFMFVVNLTLCVATISLINIFPYQVGSLNASVNVFLVCELTKVFAVLHRNLAFNDLEYEILQNFQSVELLFRSSLQRPISFTLFKRNFTKKLCLAFGSFILLLIFISVRHTVHGRMTLPNVMVEVVRFISIIVCTHALLFIDLMTFYLKHLNAIIAGEINNGSTDEEHVFVVKNLRTSDVIRKQLDKYKAIYFRLWRIAEQLNEYFGWSLLALMMLFFVDFVISVIWQLKVLNDFTKFMRLTRKNHSSKLLITGYLLIVALKIILQIHFYTS